MNEALLASAINQIPQPHGDEDGYIKDGLLYCSTCNHPKQTKINIFGGEKIVYVMCLCETRREEEARKNFKAVISGEELNRMLDIALPDPDMRNHTFDNDNGKQPRMKDAYKYAKDFGMHLERGSGLLIYGECGTGKSYAAEAIANQVIRDGYPTLITRFSIIAEAASKCGYEERSNYYASLNKYPLLVVDDLGVEKETEYMMEVIHRVVDERDRSGKPMIISTNKTIDDIKRPKSDEWARIWSRIMRRCIPLKFTGPDMRKEQFAEHYRKMQKYFSEEEKL